MSSQDQPEMNPLARLEPHLRVDFGGGVRFGPGKADLIEAIARTGSISGAGRELGMSYRRAWLLVEEMNTLFATPLVTASAGGVHGGGARVTPLGEAVAAAFRRLEARTRAATREEFAPFAGDIA